jgi:hypothetical protein
MPSPLLLITQPVEKEENMNGFDDGWFLPYVIFQQQFRAHPIQSCTVTETHITVNTVSYITTIDYLN